MHEAQNTKLIQDAFGDFGRGDIPSLLARLDPAIVWHGITGAASYVPTAGIRKGPAAVGDFFKTMSQEVAYSQFEPREFVAQGDKVIVLGHYAAKVVRTGRTFESDWVMVFTVRNGKLIEFQEFTDSSQLNAAYAS